MELNHFRIKSIVSKVFVESCKKAFIRFLFIGLVILLIKFIVQCEGKDRYYRPNLPEKLCSIGIIDVDDTILRHISFEKSYQSEFSEELNDSLREFSFTIFSPNGELYNYQCDSTIKNLKDLRIPSSISFIPGEKYSLVGNEKNTEEISAESIATEPPSKPHLITINKEITTLSESMGCIEDITASSAIINFSFDIDQNLYYAIMVEGWGFSSSSSLVPWPGYLDFSIRKGNSVGFFAEMQGLKIYHYGCSNGQVKAEESPGYAYFIEGEMIRDSKCVLTLSVQYNDGYCVYEVFKALRVKIMSIPKELYLFEKSLYTYKKTSGDPFTEPIYLNGNIKGGNGVFAICRSSDLTLTFSPWY